MKQTIVREAKNFIGGRWLSAADEPIQLFNPANYDELVAVVQNSSEKEVNLAVEAAAAAKQKWALTSGPERAACLQRAADLFEKYADELAEIATKEMGKRLAETKAEVQRSASILRYYAGEGFRKLGEVLPSSDPSNLFFSKRVPVGVVAVIAPWNFPLAIPVWKMAPALAYGNTVVFKPALEASATGARIVEIFEEAQFPPGTVNLVIGRGSRIGDALVQHEKVDAITFTGSNAIGCEIAKKAAARGAKYQLELGGKNPAIVLKDADLDFAARLVVEGAMKQTGQRCTATSRVFVEKEVISAFREKVVQEVQRIRVGDGMDPNVTMGPVVSKNQYETILRYIEIGKREGRLITGGKACPHLNGWYIEPTVFDHVSNTAIIAREEIFGPVLSIIETASLDEAISMANDTIYGLSASLFTNDLSKALYFVDRIEAGMVQVNGETGGAEPQAPFGGMKQSSSGTREQGQAAVEFFTTYKTVAIRPQPFKG
ncbi:MULTISPECIES: aldehyde dehydrogenase family protein [unclassified Geobacillus]|uniref:aldehyde dehydrogenase family protein n=1 Tax=unclassified Geobacillus TaxID=2642459 RepID=UPI000BE43757|nr:MULTISPECIES: aldehyde dehydrogenase family protein [unclassified Geobacillus]PDM40898.1 aldehyde dehydrogenase family protein [Parageobacillus yumthangensis]PUF89471.1 aldehyde dehydrogenase family protein [Geobacillus sp. LYN3]RDV23090.1 aldehyde dehydrogenase family protein [Parageobacillus toebii]TXK86481.1 aldehyde dehydrogenase family protein [Geobacillus sp. AYS3]